MRNIKVKMAKLCDNNKLKCCLYRDLDIQLSELSLYAHVGDDDGEFASCYLVVSPSGKAREFQLLTKNDKFFPIHFLCKKGRKIKKCGRPACEGELQKITNLATYEFPRLLFVPETGDEKFDKMYSCIGERNERHKFTAKCTGCDQVVNFDYMFFELDNPIQSSQRYFLTWEGDKVTKVIFK